MVYLFYCVPNVHLGCSEDKMVAIDVCRLWYEYMLIQASDRCVYQNDLPFLKRSIVVQKIILKKVF
jgi:hypothetical protein